MKFSKKRNQYEASNVSFSQVEMKALSYGWWQFVALVGDKVVFNNYSYSPSTSKHQYKVRQLLCDLGIKVDFIVHSHTGLQHSEWQNEYAKEIDDKIKTLEKAIAAPRSHKAKNEERKAMIESYLEHKDEMLKLGKSKLEFYLTA